MSSAISPVTGKITPLSPATVTAPSHGSLGVAVTPDAGLAAKVTAPATALATPAFCAEGSGR